MKLFGKRSGLANEVRAVWLTAVDSELLRSRDRIQQGVRQLKDLGFNTLYPVVWQRGFTLYPSAVAKAVVGEAIVPNADFLGRDVLAEVIEAAKAHNFRVIPWFEYGLAALPGSALVQRHPDWLTLDQRGETIRLKHSDGKPDFFVWLNPCQPQVQQFIVDLIAEVVAHYEVDGIQLDDHFGFPLELGYDALTDKLYQSEQGKPQPANPHHPERQTWAIEKMTALLAQVMSAVKSSRSDCQISISPNPLAFSKANYAIDWESWVKRGLVDELVLQVYRDNWLSFMGELSKPEVAAVRDRIPTIIGVLTGLKTKSIRTSLLEQQLKTVRQQNFAGIACFFYETIFYESLSPSRIARSQTELRRLFPIA